MICMDNIMKIFIQSLILIFALNSNCYSDDKISKITNPTEVAVELPNSSGIPKELQGLQWNRWTSKNFTVCAINDAQAQYLHKHLELVKVWIFARWGMYDVDFSSECKIIGVDDPVLFKKLFNLDSTYVEVRRDSNGKIKETIIFILLKDKPSLTVPIPLTHICMVEFGQKYNVKLPLWAQKGMGQLNGTIDQIKERIAEIKPILDNNEPIYFSKGLMEMDEDSYTKLDDGKKRLYDNCSLIMCLMIRKEFGQDSYLKLMKGTTEAPPEIALKNVLKFENYNLFDKSFKRYITDIARDIVAGKTPDNYLQIKEK